MSADNGIYILYTEREDEVPEYRVAYAQAIDNVYGKYNDETYKYDGDDQVIKQTFGESKVFEDLNEALDFAEELSDNYEYLEEGICLISEFKNKGYLFEE